MQCPSCNLDLDGAERTDLATVYCPFCEISWINEDGFEMSIHGPISTDSNWISSAHKEETRLPTSDNAGPP